MHLDEVRSGLERFVRDTLGPDARIEGLVESDGHAGLTFLFEIVQQGARRGHVVKLPPKGVALRGNTDVYRQAPLLRALKAAGLPVPGVPWAHEDNPWFEVPFIVMERLPGRTFFVWDAHPAIAHGPAECRQRWEQCVAWLARLHAFDWQAGLSGWEVPAGLAQDIARWEKVYAQAPEPAWIDAAETTERALLERLPDAAPVGLFHGDYQPGNCLYDGARLTGIIDWELSGIGAQLLDVGWLAMIVDPSNWSPGWRPLHPITPVRVREVYEAERGVRCRELPWYQAFAGYRLASIACLNVKLHRTGRRHDPLWENIGQSVLPMLTRAQALLAGLG